MLTTQITKTTLFAVFLSLGCEIGEVNVTSSGDCGDGDDGWDSGEHVPETSSASVTSTSGADSTGEAPCQGFFPVDDTIVSECCPESLGSCSDWCAGLGQPCLETIISVGDEMCGSPVEHVDLCEVDPFDVIIASELSVQCVCGEPEPEQCDVNVDGKLEADDTYTYSPCYTAEDFSCSTCSAWCTTVGFESCHHVLSDASECPATDSNPLDLCEEPLLEDLTGSIFRCACA